MPSGDTMKTITNTFENKNLAVACNICERCLGSTQHLKSKFGQGYNLEIKLKQRKELDDEPLRQFVCKVSFCQSCIFLLHFFKILSRSLSTTHLIVF